MYATLMVGLALSIGAPAKEPDKKDATIVGVWNGEKGVRGGKERPLPKGGITFSFTEDGKFKVKEGDREDREVGTYKADAKKDPAEIDLTPPADKTEGPILGIYKVDGDTLTLCIGREGGERPTKFDSPDGSRIMLMTFKRAKKEK